MASTYVQITREEFEAWLDGISSRGWERKRGTVGVYIIALSDRVGVEVSSSLTGREDVMEKAQASMQMRLVSRLNGLVLNKKAQGQDHFKRTKGWRDSLTAGFRRMEDAYQKGESFYEALAEIRDRDVYQREMLAKIEAVPDWDDDNLLAQFHSQVSKGGILTLRQRDLVEKAGARRPAPPSVDDTLVADMRRLYAAARAADDQWLMQFLVDVAKLVKAGRKLTPRQQGALDRGFAKYHVNRGGRTAGTTTIFLERFHT